MMTLGFIRCMQEKGIRIPEDISVVSYDNTINRFLPWVQICSVEQNTSKLGQAACDLLFSFIENNDTKVQTIVLHPTLVVKDSVKKI